MRTKKIILITIISAATILYISAASNSASKAERYENAKRSITGRDHSRPSSKEGKKSLEDGIKILKQLIKEGRKDTETKFFLAKAYVTLSRTYNWQKASQYNESIDRAKDICKTILAAESGNNEVRLFYAKLLKKEEHSEELKKILEIEPDSIHALFHLGRYQIFRDETREQGFEKLDKVAGTEQGLLTYGRRIEKIFKYRQYRGESRKVRDDLMELKRKKRGK